MSIIELLAIIVIIICILIHKFKCPHKWMKMDEKTLKCIKCGVLECNHNWEEVGRCGVLEYYHDLEEIERIRNKKNNDHHERTIEFTIMCKCKYCNKIKTEFIKI